MNIDKADFICFLTVAALIGCLVGYIGKTLGW